MIDSSDWFSIGLWFFYILFTTPMLISLNFLITNSAEIGMGKDKTHLCLWKALFSSLLGWWDNKKNRSYPTLSTRLVVMHFGWVQMNHHGSKEKFNCLIGKWENIVKRKGTKTFTCGKDSSPAIIHHHEWWDYRNNKKNSRSPDFKHRDTGEALRLNPNYPPRVNLQIQFAWFKHGSRAPRATEVQVVVLVSLIGCMMAESIRAGPLKEEWVWVCL